MWFFLAYFAIAILALTFKRRIVTFLFLSFVAIIATHMYMLYDGPMNSSYADISFYDVLSAPSGTDDATSEEEEEEEE